MNLKRYIRAVVVLFVMSLIVVGLASCKLPASSGPQSTSQTNDGFPVPGNTEPTKGIDISTFATQTAQAKPPIMPTGNPYPAPTEVTTAPTEVPPTEAAPTSTPVTTPLAYVTATPGGPPATYTLAEGEFPYCIARRFNVDLNELLSLNGLTLESLLSPGQELKIPQTGNPFIGQRVLHEHPTTYKILEGDTLNRIACYYGDLSPDMIALQNGLTSYTNLPAGETLIIP